MIVRKVKNLKSKEKNKKKRRVLLPGKKNTVILFKNAHALAALLL